MPGLTPQTPTELFLSAYAAGTAQQIRSKEVWAQIQTRGRKEERHAHAQVPSHRSPSVERFRIHVKSMVRSTGRLDGFPEVGRRRGPWSRRWAKDLLDASTEGENNSLRNGAACQDYAETAIARRRNHRYQPLTGNTTIRRRPADRGAELERALATILFVDIVRSTEKAARLGDSRWAQVMNHYYAAIRRELKTLRGKEVVTTGDDCWRRSPRRLPGSVARPQSAGAPHAPIKGRIH